MKINSITTPISFQKRFMTTANVLKNGKKYECDIFEINPIEDDDYFKKIKKDKKWKNAEFLSEATEGFPYGFLCQRTYTIENKKEECLGFVNIDCENENKIEIDLLEVCPQYTHKNKQRDIKYIGQALINFLIELAKEENKEEITVPTIYEDAIDFYEKCGFSFIFTQEENAKLTSDKFDDALEQNRNNLNNNKKFFV